jgi:hypothetical protein
VTSALCDSGERRKILVATARAPGHLTAERQHMVKHTSSVHDVHTFPGFPATPPISTDLSGTNNLAPAPAVARCRRTAPQAGDRIVPSLGIAEP